MPNKDGVKPPDPSWPHPKPDDYKAISDALDFAKVDATGAKALYDLIGTSINIVTGIISVVGAAQAVLELAQRIGILGKDPAVDTAAELNQISGIVQDIYQWLKATDRQHQNELAGTWRADLEVEAGQRSNVLNQSRDPSLISHLQSYLDKVYGDLVQMLDPAWSTILYNPVVYAQREYDYLQSQNHSESKDSLKQQVESTSWTRAARGPCMRLSGAGPSIDYKDDGVTRIWDPGYYIDTLIRGLSEWITTLAVLEPAFRSTGFDRQEIHKVATGLDAFIRDYEASFFVADPDAGLNGGGQLMNPLDDNACPLGIMLGAADPVTGATNISTWFDFASTYTETVYPIPVPPYTYRVPVESHADDVQAARAAAAAEQAKRFDQIHRASFVPQLKELSAQLHAALEAPTGSDFVEFSWPVTLNAPHPVQVSSEPVSFGNDVPFVLDPAKSYAATRYQEDLLKSFHFRIPKRGDGGDVRLGYTLVVGDESTPGGHMQYELCRLSRSQADGNNINLVDETPIITVDKYLCCQTGSFSPGQESALDAGEATGGAERILLPRGSGSVKIAVMAEYDAGDSMDYVGTVRVYLGALHELDPYTEAFTIPVRVYETHVASAFSGQDFVGEVVTVLADEMTVFMAPNYAVVGKDFVADYHSAMAAAEQIHAEMRKTVDRRVVDPRHVRPVPPGPDPAPFFLRRSISEQSLRIQLAELSANHVQVAEMLSEWWATNGEATNGEARPTFERESTFARVEGALS